MMVDFGYLPVFFAGEEAVPCHSLCNAKALGAFAMPGLGVMMSPQSHQISHFGASAGRNLPSLAGRQTGIFNMACSVVATEIPQQNMGNVAAKGTMNLCPQGVLALGLGLRRFVEYQGCLGDIYDRGVVLVYSI